MTQQRQFPRYALGAALTMRPLDGVGDEITGRAENLSRGGLCAMLAAPLPVGDRLEVELALVFENDSFSEPLTLTARVVWCTAMGSRFQLGLSFGPQKSDTLRYLDLFLKFLEDGRQARDED